MITNCWEVLDFISSNVCERNALFITRIGANCLSDLNFYFLDAGFLDAGGNLNCAIYDS
jgi:hypothetical protein